MEPRGSPKIDVNALQGKCPTDETGLSWR